MVVVDVELVVEVLVLVWDVVVEVEVVVWDVLVDVDVELVVDVVVVV